MTEKKMSEVQESLKGLLPLMDAIERVAYITGDIEDIKEELEEDGYEYKSIPEIAEEIR